MDGWSGATSRAGITLCELLGAIIESCARESTRGVRVREEGRERDREGKTDRESEREKKRDGEDEREYKHGRKRFCMK